MEKYGSLDRILAQCSGDMGSSLNIVDAGMVLPGIVSASGYEPRDWGHDLGDEGTQCKEHRLGCHRSRYRAMVVNRSLGNAGYLALWWVCAIGVREYDVSCCEPSKAKLAPRPKRPPRSHRLQ